MDRVLSLFGLYDVLGYLISGLALLVGIWWVAEGHLPGLSPVAFAGLLGAGYIAGQISATAGRGWEACWWLVRGGKPGIRMMSRGDYGFSEEMRKSIVSQIEVEIGIRDLRTEQRFKLARAKLRLFGFDRRAETMRAMHGLCRNLAASLALVGLAAIGAAVVGEAEARLWIAAALFLPAAPAFAYRAVRYERRFSQEVWTGFIALRMRPGG